MRILVVGSGGREHALAWKLAQAPGLERLYAAPGNPGIAEVGLCAPIAATDVDALASFACDERIDLAVIGPETPLVAGLADALRAQGVPTFGASAAAAQIEASKVFCREFCRRHGIPMAQGAEFDDPAAAADFARGFGAERLVVRADGLAAGKGVLICDDPADAVRAIDTIMRERTFGDAGSRVVVEEFLDGREVSVFCLTDGETVLALETAQDYKRVLDGDRGLNTGGMGAYSPSWLSTELRDRAVKEIAEPAVRGLADEGRAYVGCLYVQLMYVGERAYLIEFNARFGDPETQVLMPRMTSDLASLALAAATGSLAGCAAEWSRDAFVGLVVAAKGYPGRFLTGQPVGGIEDALAVPGTVVFHAATSVVDGRLVSSGGRVLNVVGRGGTVAEARSNAYASAERIKMDERHFRTDIAAGVATPEREARRKRD